MLVAVLVERSLAWPPPLFPPPVSITQSAGVLAISGALADLGLAKTRRMAPVSSATARRVAIARSRPEAKGAAHRAGPRAPRLAYLPATQDAPVQLRLDALTSACRKA